MFFTTFQPMNPPAATAPSLVSDVYWPMMKASAIIAAGRIGLFGVLRDGPLSGEVLARRLGASVDGVQRLCSVLIQAGYLVRGGDDRLANGEYAQARLAGRVDCDHSDLGGLCWSAHAWRLMSGLEAAVMAGGPGLSLWEQMKERPEMGREFAAFMKEHAAGLVDELQRLVSLPEGASTLLDVGGSHGLHAAAFCRRHASLRAVVFDLPVSLGTTRNHLAERGLADRIRCVEGDIRRDPIEGSFDVITYFMVAHNQSDADNARAVAKMARALNPGGLLAVHEYVRDPAARFSISPEETAAAAFDLTLLVETGTRIHTADRITAWLTDAGLEGVVRSDLRDSVNGAVFCARRPAGG